MKQRVRERYIVVVLFIMVLVVFSFAQRDSEKLQQLYQSSQAYQPFYKKTIASGNELPYRNSNVIFSRQ